MSTRRRRRPASRVIAVTLLFLVALPLAAFGLCILLIDPNAYKARIEKAARRATGRDMVIRGDIRLRPSLTPTITADDVTLANAAGGGAADMATIGRLEAEIALPPLFFHAIVVNRLVLSQPRIVLETSASGVANWSFARAPAAAAAGAAAGPPDGAEPAPTPWRFEIRAIALRDGDVTWRDGATGRSVAARIARMDVAAPELEAPITAHAEFSVGGREAVADVTAGSLAGLLYAPDSADWPLRVSAHAGADTASVTGTLRQPSRGVGYDLQIDAAIADPAALSAAFGRGSPRLPPFSFAGHVAGRAGGVPVWSDLALRAGPAPLDGIAHHVDLTALRLTAASVADPVRGEVSGTYRGAPFSARGTIGSLDEMLRARTTDASMPVDLTARFAGADLTATGTVASLAHLSGVEIALAAHAPDLAALSPAAGIALPPLRNIAVTAALAESDGGLTDGILLRNLTVAAPRSELSGEATIRYGRRPSVAVVLSSPRLDLDAPRAGEATAASPVASAPASPPTPAPAPAPESARRAEPSEQRIFLDRPLPVAALRAVDADIDVKLAAMLAGGATYRDAALHLVLRDGHLSVDPLSVETPGGRIEGTLTADASAAAMSVALGLHARALALKPLLAALGEPDSLAGTAVVDIDLRGRGTTPHDLAASADGHIGVSLGDGEVDNRLLATVLADTLKNPKLGEAIGLTGAGAGAAVIGRTRLRCLAARLDVSGGTATVTTFLLDSTRLLAQGAGTITLGDEALALRLRPQLRLGAAGGGQGLAVPLRIGGSFAAPKIGVDAVGALEGLAARAGAGQADKGAESCPAALAAVTAPTAAPPPAPAAETTPPAAPSKSPNAAQILRGLPH